MPDNQRPHDDECSLCPTCRMREHRFWMDEIRKQRLAQKVEEEAPRQRIKQFPSPSLLRSKCEQQVEKFLPQAVMKDQKFYVAWEGKKHYSSTPLEALKSVGGLKGMKLGKRYEGGFLVVRSISRVSTMGGFWFVSQDVEGDACIVGWDCPLWGTRGDVDELLPIATIMTIKEPKLSKTQDGYPLIHVFSPTDIHFNQSEDFERLIWKYPLLGIGLPKTVAMVGAEAHKALGDAAMKKKRYVAAERAYTAALKTTLSTGSLLITLRLNRSLARLKIGLHRSALRDAKFVLSLQTDQLTKALRSKALFRGALASYKLQLWNESGALFKELDALGVEGLKQGKEGLEKVAARKKEALTGEYDWTSLYDASQTNGQDLDVADYISPKLVVQDISCQGRGLVAKRDIESGELLMLVRPFAMVTPEEVKNARPDVATLNLHAEATVDWPAQSLLTQKIAMRLLEDPPSRELFDLLYAGPTYPQPPNFSINKLTKPKSDNLNSSPSSSYNVDLERVELVRYFCALTIVPLGVIEVDKGPGTWASHKDQSSGLYVLPSLLNHSCLPNCAVYFIGECCYVRALHDVEEGEELLISYASGLPYRERMDVLTRYNIDCYCPLCEEEDSVDPSEYKRLDRADLLFKLNHLPGPSDTKLGDDPEGMKTYLEAEEIVEELEGTYGSWYPQQWKYELWSAYHHMAVLASYIGRNHFEISTRQQKKRQAIEWETKALAVLGVEEVKDKSKDGFAVKQIPPWLHDQALQSVVSMWSKLSNSHKTDDVAHWIMVGDLIDEDTVGAGYEVFNKRLKDVFDHYGGVLEFRKTRSSRKK